MFFNPKQLAGLLTELKELRSIVDACNILAVDAFAVEKLCKELKEAKRLLKSAVEAINWINEHTQDEDCSCIMRTNSGCSGCPLDINGDLFCKWKHNDEALKLIEKGEQNCGR